MYFIKGNPISISFANIKRNKFSPYHEIEAEAKLFRGTIIMIIHDYFSR
jgi:hypothetical protein